MPNSTPVMILSSESIEQYRQWSIGKGLAENTVRAYTRDLRMFLQVTALTEVPMEQVEDLAQAWLNMTRLKDAPKTIQCRLVSLRSFARWARHPETLAEYMPPTPQRGEAHPLPGLATDLLNLSRVASNPNEKAAVGLMGYIGCRVSEARSITPEAFNLEAMTIKIRGKGDKTRVVPVSEKAWHLTMDAFVFASVNDTPLITWGDRFTRQTIKNMGKRAQITREIASHDLRMTYGTIIFDKTLNIRLVQELLGHESVETTETYTGVRMADMKKAVEF
jgi:site-specific recombinase XerD